jgi:predicted  nucleic acid-binding Zn-ribbon protein
MSTTPSERVADDEGGAIGPVVTPAEVERSWRDNRGGAPRRCIVVAGMHRSGCSAVAGALCAAGAWAGPESDLIPVALNKPRGRFERRAAANALEAELVERGGSWSNPPLGELQPWTQARLRPTLRRVLAMATSDTPRGAVALIKDPRLCLFAAELRTLLPDDWPVVLMVRHPLEVARSLHDRDGLSIPAGLALWEIYNQSICSGLAGRPVHVLRYDSLIDDTGGVAARLVDQVLADSGQPARSAQDRVAAHLSRELRHHRADVADEDRWLSVAALRLWHQLESASQSPEPTTLPVVELSYGAAQHVSVEANLRALETQVREQSEQLAVRATDRAEHENLQTKAQQLQSANQTLADDVAGLEAKLAVAEQRLAESQAYTETNEALGSRIDELTVANQDLEQLVESLRDLRGRALQGWADSERLVEQLAQTNAQLDERYQTDVRRLLIELDTARGEVESARSGYAEAREEADALLESSAALSAALSERAREVDALVKASSALSAALNETAAELSRVDRHRTQLVADINAIGSSQSWRIGYAITWPVRALRRSGTPEGRAADPTS